ncbi:MAG: hypothetical protein WCX08_04410 [Candidatus Buchananbacteria bacterium]
MDKVQPGHEVLSLFGMSASQALIKKLTNYSLIASLVGAFFIIFVVSLLFGSEIKNLSAKSSVAAPTVSEEKTAYLPGQFVSREISRGYLGSYR